MSKVSKPVVGQNWLKIPSNSYFFFPFHLGPAPPPNQAKSGPLQLLPRPPSFSLGRATLLSSRAEPSFPPQLPLSLTGPKPPARSLSLSLSLPYPGWAKGPSQPPAPPSQFPPSLTDRRPPCVSPDLPSLALAAKWARPVRAFPYLQSSPVSAIAERPCEQVAAQTEPALDLAQPCDRAKRADRAASTRPRSILDPSLSCTPRSQTPLTACCQAPRPSSSSRLLPF